MRVAIDLTALNAKPSGIDRYLEGMVRSLAQLENDTEFFLFINLEDRTRFSGAARLPKRFHLAPICLRPRLVRLFFQQFLQPLLLYLLRIDVLHSPTFIMPLWRGSARHVLTIHDMSSFVLPQCHPLIRRGALYERIVRASILRADLVSVPSQAVKNDILRLVPEIDPPRIRVIPCGIDDAFHPLATTDVQMFLQRLAIAQPYILYLGTLDPRKNLRCLLAAFAELVAAGRPEHLVVGGAASWSPNEGLSAHASAELQNRLHLTGYVAEADLPFLYSGAALFVYPSLLEGFGFPPLEAMASGIPVIAADNSSLRENLAGAAILVSAEEVPALAEAMRALLTNETMRARYVEAGLERSASFRWENFGRKTLACYGALA